MKLARIAFRIHYPFWQFSCWLWVRHEVPGTRWLFHGILMRSFAWLHARAGMEI